MANLASSYNNMSDHIQRLIEAQRELMRARFRMNSERLWP